MVVAVESSVVRHRLLFEVAGGAEEDAVAAARLTAFLAFILVKMDVKKLVQQQGKETNNTKGENLTMERHKEDTWDKKGTTKNFWRSLLVSGFLLDDDRLEFLTFGVPAHCCIPITLFPPPLHCIHTVETRVWYQFHLQTVTISPLVVVISLPLPI